MLSSSRLNKAEGIYFKPERPWISVISNILNIQLTQPVMMTGPTIDLQALAIYLLMVLCIFTGFEYPS
jgi:hypothetical protein